MTVLMTFRVKGDIARLEQLAAESPDTLPSIGEKAKQFGVISHRFYGNDDGEIMVLDEWESAEGFQRFFESSPEIPQLMGSVGVTDQPEVKFWRKLETHDEI